jgi:hypothetical protein
LGIGLLVVESPQLMQVNVQVLQQSRLSRARAIGTITKRTTGATDGPKSLKGFCLALLCQLAADRLAGCRRVDARFTLAVWTLASRPIAFWKLVPSDACHYRHWSLSALVTVGAGWREKPLHQPVTIQRLIQFAVQTKPPVPA